MICTREEIEIDAMKRKYDEKKTVRFFCDGSLHDYQQWFTSLKNSVCLTAGLILMPRSERKFSGLELKC